MNKAQESFAVEFLRTETLLLRVWKEIRRRKMADLLSMADSDSYRTVKHIICDKLKVAGFIVQVPEVTPLMERAIAYEEKYFQDNPVRNLVGMLYDQHANLGFLMEEPVAKSA